MRKNWVFIGLMAIAVAFTGCKKEEGELEIELNTPLENTEYTSPVALDAHIHGGDLIIHDIEIKVFETANVANVIFDYDNHVEVTDFDVVDVITANVTAPTTFTIQINVGEDDHTASLSRNFIIKP